MLTVAEVALIFKRTPYTVRAWCREGKIEAVKTPGGRGYLIPERAVAGRRPETTAERSERAARAMARIRRA